MIGHQKRFKFWSFENDDTSAIGGGPQSESRPNFRRNEPVFGRGVWGSFLGEGSPASTRYEVGSDKRRGHIQRSKTTKALRKVSGL
jgi:hypothetical protein